VSVGKHAQIQVVKLGRAGARIRPSPHAPPAALSMHLKQQALRSLGITAALSALVEQAFTLSPSAPLVQNRAALNLYSPDIVAGEGWAEFSASTPGASLDVMFLNVTSASRYLLDLAVISLGGTTTFSARPVLDRSGIGQTNALAPGSTHVLFAVEATSSNSGIEISCDSDYQFHSCEITPLPPA
jgi:hypothetical protein